MKAIRYANRPRPAIMARAQQVSKQKRQRRTSTLITTLQMVAFIAVIIASGYCNK